MIDEATNYRRQNPYPSRMVGSEVKKRGSMRHYRKCIKGFEEKRTGNRAIGWEDFYGKTPVEIQEVPRPI
tara:strand:- start:431 stop:640 length:210 start_codon:yes stop_codon:yes gene_type:complete